MALSDEDIREILRIVDESDLDELLIEAEGLTLHVRRGAAAAHGEQVPRPPAEPSSSGSERSSSGAQPSASATPAERPARSLATDGAAADGGGTGGAAGAAVAGGAVAGGAVAGGAVAGGAAAGGAAAGGAVAGGAAADGWATITSPMLGTFYRADSPGAAPFVEVGSEVEPDQSVCIIEVMKMMNSVPAGVRGTIVEVLADNGQLVEYGQPLFRVAPADAGRPSAPPCSGEGAAAGEAGGGGG